MIGLKVYAPNRYYYCARYKFVENCSKTEIIKIFSSKTRVELIDENKRKFSADCSEIFATKKASNNFVKNYKIERQEANEIYHEGLLKFVEAIIKLKKSFSGSGEGS